MIFSHITYWFKIILSDENIKCSVKEAALRRTCAGALDIIKNYPTNARKSFTEMFFLLSSSSCIYMVNRPASISKSLGRDFSIKTFLKNCHPNMVGHKKWFLEPRKHLSQNSEVVILGLNQRYNRVSKWKWEGKSKQINLTSKLNFPLS